MNAANELSQHIAEKAERSGKPAKDFPSRSDKNTMKRLAQRVGNIARFLLRLIHLGNAIQRDTDFLGYEAFSRMHSELLRTAAPAKRATDAK